MNQPAVEPIRNTDLEEFCRFLVENLSQQRTAEEWARAFQQDWGVDKPNNGFLLRTDGQIVGGIGAIYARRIIRGKAEQFCNITSWCVLEQYRSQSMRLAIALTSQPGYHFSDLTPTEVVSKTLQFLKFRPMNERQAVWPNIPWPIAAARGVRTVTDSNAIGEVLSQEDNHLYRDHRHLNWLNHLAIGQPGEYCYIVYRKCRLRGLPGAYVLAFSDPGRFLNYRLALGSYLLFHHGLCFTKTESRLLHRIPQPSIELKGFRNKVYRSDTLTETDMSNLYTEVVALDM